MKVILLCDVKGTGKKDDILTVSDGFARNYLFPRKWAAEATPGAVKEIERKRANGPSGGGAPGRSPEDRRFPQGQDHQSAGEVR